MDLIAWRCDRCGAVNFSDVTREARSYIMGFDAETVKMAAVLDMKDGAPATNVKPDGTVQCRCGRVFDLRQTTGRAR